MVRAIPPWPQKQERGQNGAPHLVMVGSGLRFCVSLKSYPALAEPGRGTRAPALLAWLLVAVPAVILLTPTLTLMLRKIPVLRAAEAGD